jgi:hypothetical protein
MDAIEPEILTIGSKLVQRKFLHGRQTFDFSDGHLVNVQLVNWGKVVSYDVPLTQINPNPSRVKNTDFRPLVLLIPFALIAGFSLLALLIIPVISQRYDLMAGSVFLILIFSPISVALAIHFYLKSVDSLVFSASNGQKIALWFNKPTPQLFREFADDLRNTVSDIRMRQKPNNSLSGEIVRLKQLFDHGLINQNQYDAAIAKLTGGDFGSTDAYRN